MWKKKLPVDQWMTSQLTKRIRCSPRSADLRSFLATITCDRAEFLRPPRRRRLVSAELEQQRAHVRTPVSYQLKEKKAPRSTAGQCSYWGCRDDLKRAVGTHQADDLSNSSVALLCSASPPFCTCQSTAPLPRCRVPGTTERKLSGKLWKSKKHYRP